ncbi:MAG: branched-chain amino acid transaminase [Acidobacteriota bacterium]
MPVKNTDWIWMNGKFVPWNEAHIHVLSHVIHYGSSVFEGIRCYETPKGPRVLRLKDHIQRLYHSAKVYRMEIPYSLEEYCEVCLEVIRRNGMQKCYIRPVVFRGYGDVGVNPLPCPVDTAVAVWDWGAYLGPEALAKGVDVCVSTWNRPSPNSLPAMAKCAANYMNGQLIKMEAILSGFAEGIALDVNGYVSEGSGENIFLVRNSTVYTPSLGHAVLPGITRDGVLTILAKEMKMEVRHQAVPREMLYLADEIFFTGTAAEITPIASVDRIPVGKGQRGPITEAVQKRYLEIVQGKAEDIYGWLTPVYK